MHDVYGRWIRVRVVGADLFDETAIALGAGVGGYDVVEGLAFLTVTLESEACCHLKNVLKGSETPLLIPRKWAAKIGRHTRTNNLFVKSVESSANMVEELPAEGLVAEGAVVVGGDGRTLFVFDAPA